MAGIPRADRRQKTHRGDHLMGVASPPLVANGVVVTPTVISDGPITREAPPGWVKGIDARTGATKWVFRTVPRARRLRRGHLAERVVALFGQLQRLEPDQRRRGARHRLPADPAPRPPTTTAGTATATTCSPRASWRSTSRPASGLWHFQAVHHGIWDYDFPAAPNLLDITADDRRIKAVAQVSKQGFNLRLRPRDGRAGLADRRAPGTDRHGPGGRTALPHPTDPDEAAAVRVPGGDHRRPGRLHAGDPGDGRRGGARLPTRSTLLAGHADRRGRPAGHHPASLGRRRRELERCGRGPGDRDPLRAVHQPRHGREVCASRRRQPALRLAGPAVRAPAADAERSAPAQAGRTPA